jgi:alpha-L-fucosidase
MNFIKLITITVFLFTSVGIFGQDKKNTDYQKEKYEATWKSLAHHKTPDWYKNAVLGIYFHWGIYSVPAFGCWGGRNMYQPNGGTSEAWGHIDKNKYVNTYDYVKKVYGEPGTKFGYKDFIPMFKAEKWDPDSWAELFKEAGADFAGPVAIHHDGFAMWDSDCSEYNSMDMGPHRDITGEIIKAIRKQGMKTVVSFHQYTNWFFFNPGRKICPPGVDVNNPKYTGLYGPIREYKGDWQEYPFSEEFQQKWYNQIKEVIDKYKPDQIWHEIGFSNSGCVGEKYILASMAYYFNSAESWGKEVVVTRKDDDLPLSCSVLDLEGHSEDEAKPVVWQTDIALGTNHAWAYSPDAVCRSINAVIDEIVDRKSKNGVTLLDVAPKADGTLPPSQIEGLKEIGKWMSINKEALYAAKCAPYNEGGIDQWKSGTIRFTEKGNYVYAIELGNELYVMVKDEGKMIPEIDERAISGGYPDSKPPQAPYKIPGVKPVKGSKVTMLGSKMNLPWHMDGNDLVIEKLPDPLPCDYAWSFKIKIK